MCTAFLCFAVVRALTVYVRTTSVMNKEHERERVVTFPTFAPLVIDLVVDTIDNVREGMWARGMTEGVDYTIEAGRVEWSASRLRRRGWCCNHACRNCPWRQT